MSARDLPPVERLCFADAVPLLDERAATADGMPRVHGLAVPVGVLSRPLHSRQPPHGYGPPRRTPGRDGWFRERIAPEALADVLSGPDVKFLVQHDRGRVLGRRSAGTLRLDVRPQGLFFQLDPPRSPAGEDLVEAVRRRDLSAMSFGYSVPSDGDAFDFREEEGEELPVRTVRRMKVFELSAVDEGAFDQTLLAVDTRAAERAAACYRAAALGPRWTRLRRAELQIMTAVTRG